MSPNTPPHHHLVLKAAKMNGLMKRLKKIEDECVEKEKLREEIDENMDDFTRNKKKLAFEIQDLRKMIKERDELELSNVSGNRHTVEASHVLRKKIKEIKQEAQNLDVLRSKEEAKFRKKNKEDPEKEAQLDNRKEIVELIFKHIKEVESLSNKKHGDTSFMGATAETTDPTITELPNIDDEGFQMLRRNDEKIDALLNDVHVNVRVLGEMAQEMGKEAKLQGDMLDKLDTKVDKVNDDLENLNTRLRKALESVRKGDRFIVDIILLCVLLGIAGYIYSMFK